MQDKALIVGSISYDLIFDIFGKIQDEIIVKDGKVDKLNMTFTAKERRQFFGGIGGNIAYGLGSIGVSPLLFSAVGKDFHNDYEQHLADVGVDIRVVSDKDRWSATYFGISDEEQQQMAIFQPNCHYELMENNKLITTISEEELKQVKVAIFSAGTAKSIEAHQIELSKVNANATIIFDPGPIISVFYDAKIFRDSLKSADIFIVNEVELTQAEQLLGFSIEEIFGCGIDYIIETKGDKGCTVHSPERKTDIAGIKVKNVVETTGAGDSFRAGFMYGLLNDKSIEDSCKIGNYMGALSVQHAGAQGYKVDPKELAQI